jgi:heat shock protein HslJ
MTEENKDDINGENPENRVSDGDKKGGNNTVLVVVLVVALVLALIAIAALAFTLLDRDSSGTEGEVPPPVIVTAPPGPTVPLPTLIAPTPEPAEPTATVIAPLGVNVRTGPGTEYPSMGIAPQGTTLEVVGVSQDGTWYVINVPGNAVGWVAAEYVAVENVEDVPVSPAPPTPTPAATATPTATPAPQIAFMAQPTQINAQINAGGTSILSWQVENVRAVYVYPVGANFNNYPVTGQGQMEVQPYITTSYELLTFNNDGSNSAQRVQVTVVDGLTSSRWVLSAYQSGTGGLASVLPGTQVTARFSSNGDLSGSAGCNTYSGGFTAYANVLRVNSVSSSQTFCENPPGVMEQEAAFLANMSSAASFSIVGGQLTIFNGSGQTVLSFVRG